MGPASGRQRALQASAFTSRPAAAAGSATGLFRLAGTEKLAERGRELRLGERGNVVRALDDLHVAAAEQFSHRRDPVLDIIGFVPSVNEQDRSPAFAELLPGHFQIPEAATCRRDRFHVLVAIGDSLGSGPPIVGGIERGTRTPTTGSNSSPGVRSWLRGSVCG